MQTVFRGAIAQMRLAMNIVAEGGGPAFTSSRRTTAAQAFLKMSRWRTMRYAGTVGSLHAIATVANKLQLYSGPMAESLPTSVSAFNHRRSRANSTTSFSFYQDEPEDDTAILEQVRSGADDLDELPFEDELEDEESSADLERQAADNDYVLHRRASTQSRGSVHSRLLRRESAASAGSGFGGNRSSQKIYMVNEDLYIAIAGFSTSPIGLAAYIAICVSTFGLGWLLFRWIPRWHVKLVGRPATLHDCQWVVVEVNVPVP